VSGGWIVALKEALRNRPEITLEVAFLSSFSEKEDEFVSDGIRHYAIQPYKSKSYIGFRLKRLLVSMDREDRLILGRINDIVARSNPDLIHIHGTEKPFGLIADSLRGRIPLVYSIQGLVCVYADKFFSGLSKYEISRRETIGAKLGKRSFIRGWKGFVHRAANEVEFLKAADYIMGRTRWDRRISGLFNPRRKYFEVNEIMRRPFYSACWDKTSAENRFKIVSVLSYGPYKGYETLLKAASLLKENAGFDFEWQIIGYSKDEDYVRICEKSAGFASSSAGIVFLGRRTAEEMVEILCGADVFCHVSHIDNSPNSVCEAMLLGMPVIASSVGGTVDLLSDGEEGLLVQDGDAYSLAGALCEVHDDFATACSMGRNARKRALERHSPEKVCSELLAAYNGMMNGKYSEEVRS